MEPFQEPSHATGRPGEHGDAHGERRSIRSLTMEEVISKVDALACLPCISRATKIVIPAPYGKALIEPATLPNGDTNPKAGALLTDKRGNIIGTAGVIFPNHTDNCWQAIATGARGIKLDASERIGPETVTAIQGWVTSKLGSPSFEQLTPKFLRELAQYMLTDLKIISSRPGSPPVILANLAAPSDWDAVRAWVAEHATSGDPNDLSLKQFEELIGFMDSTLLLDDLYDSDQDYVTKKLVCADIADVPLNRDGAVIPYFGLMQRNDNPAVDKYFAVRVDGPVQLFRPDHTAQIGDDGLVIVLMVDEKRGIEKLGKRWYCRGMQPDRFLRSYLDSNEHSIDSIDCVPLLG